MSDPGKEIAIEAAKSAAIEIARPVSGVVEDILGATFGDRLHNWRRNKPAWQERNQRETAEQAARVFAERGCKHASDDANPVLVEEILDASKDTTAREIRELYARLIAAALDEDRIGLYRREFVRIVAELEPLDALVLQMLAEPGGLEPSRVQNIASRTGASHDAIQNAFRNLTRLELVYERAGGSPKTQPSLQPLGRQFLACVR